MAEPQQAEGGGCPSPRRCLALVPILLPEADGVLARLAAALSRDLGMAVEVRPPTFDATAAAFDATRAQYDSTRLLERLQDQAPEGGRVLGVAGVDLFVPVLTYVFGEAQLEGPAALISTHRLDDRLYGLPPNPARQMERTVKEALHELGHTFGLFHCASPDCVMRGSTYVEEIDLKAEGFCGRCRRALPDLRPRPMSRGWRWWGDSDMTAVEVEAYAGQQAEETPRAFTAYGRRYEVVEELRRWREPDRDGFEVRADDGGLWRLVRLSGGRWYAL